MYCSIESGDLIKVRRPVAKLLREDEVASIRCKLTVGDDVAAPINNDDIVQRSYHCAMTLECDRRQLRIVARLRLLHEGASGSAAQAEQD